MGKKFPVRFGAVAYHGNRKLWAKGFLSGLGQRRFIMSILFVNLFQKNCKKGVDREDS